MSKDVLRARAKWQYTGAWRPSFATPTEPGQESVWDYPRPPRIESDARRVVVRADGRVVADSCRALRVVETASPPAFYLPAYDVDVSLLERGSGSSLCEWKGEAYYWDLVAPERRTTRVAWSYPQPYPEFDSIREHFAFFPAALECWLDGGRVESQPGGFYGGWVTPEIVGPIKGQPGSTDW